MTGSHQVWGPCSIATRLGAASSAQLRATGVLAGSQAAAKTATAAASTWQQSRAPFSGPSGTASQSTLEPTSQTPVSPSHPSSWRLPSAHTRSLPSGFPRRVWAESCGQIACGQMLKRHAILTFYQKGGCVVSSQSVILGLKEKVFCNKPFGGA